MKFVDLYEYANGMAGDVIPVRELRTHIIAHHPNVGGIEFYPVDLDENVSLGHIKYERDRTSAYDDEFTVANIRFSKTLNRCMRRYVCCKEMMHVFDSPEERVDSADKFLRLMNELEAIPLKEDISPMFASELNAEWMAALVLCPQRLRDALRPAWVAGEKSDYDVALALKIPETIIKGIMGDYYDSARAILTKA